MVSSPYSRVSDKNKDFTWIIALDSEYVTIIVGFTDMIIARFELVDIFWTLNSEHCLPEQYNIKL